MQLPVELKDYRPVSILPILSKTYERVVLEQITNITEKKLKCHHYQSGYHKNHSTATLLLKLRDGIKKQLKPAKYRKQSLQITRRHLILLAFLPY